MTRQPDFSSRPGAGRHPLRDRVLLAASALLLLFAVAQAVTARREARDAHERLQDVTREVRAVAARHEALQARARLPGGTSLPPEQAPPARIVAELASILPGDVRLDRLAIDYAHGGQIEMLVVARDASAWDRLLQAIERAPSLREVEAGPEARAAEVRSVVRARWAPEAP